MPEDHSHISKQESLISDEVADIIHYQPHWMVRKGNSILFLVLLFFLSLSLLIKYPDVIAGTARLRAVNAPKLITSKVQGKLQRLFVRNDQQVKKDEFLGYLESTADYAQVQTLRSWINTTLSSLQQNKINDQSFYSVPELSELGELQANYQDFQTVLAETRQIFSNGYYQKKKTALSKDLRYLSALKSSTSEQKNLLEGDLQLQNIEYEAKKSLANDKIIAPLELNQDKSKVIAKQQVLEQIKAQVVNSDFASHNKQKEIIDLDKFMADQQQKFRSSLIDLKSEIEKWVRQYALVAPENGKVLFVSFLQENQLLSGGQELFYVQPEETNYYCELLLPQSGMGKVKIGQNVIIKIESYPSAEFGFLKGKVTYISNIPGPGDSFSVKVDLADGLRTNYSKRILFRNNLSARGEILTDSRRLFDRLTGQLQRIWDR